jgi:hypothetical protein
LTSLEKETTTASVHNKANNARVVSFQFSSLFRRAGKICIGKSDRRVQSKGISIVFSVVVRSHHPLLLVFCGALFDVDDDDAP